MLQLKDRFKESRLVGQVEGLDGAAMTTDKPKALASCSQPGYAIGSRPALHMLSVDSEPCHLTPSWPISDPYRIAIVALDGNHTEIIPKTHYI